MVKIFCPLSREHFQRMKENEVLVLKILRFLDIYFQNGGSSRNYSSQSY